MKQSLLIILSFTLLLFANCGTDEQKTKAQTETIQSKPSVIAEDALQYSIERKIINSNHTEISAYLKEKPRDSSHVANTIKYIAQYHGDNTGKIKVWLYATAIQAKNDRLKSEWVGTYFINHDGGAESVLISNAKIDLLNGADDENTKYYRNGLTKINNLLKSKGIGYCDLHIEMEEAMKNTYREADNAFAPGTEANIKYQEKLSLDWQKIMRKKYSLTEDQWTTIWMFSSYACDGIY